MENELHCADCGKPNARQTDMFKVALCVNCWEQRVCDKFDLPDGAISKFVKEVKEEATR